MQKEASTDGGGEDHAGRIGQGHLLGKTSRVRVPAFIALWIGKFDLQLYDFHLHPEAETSLAVQTCVSQVVVISSEQW